MIRRFALLLAIAVAAAGCGVTAPSRFYTLASTATAGGAAAPEASYAVIVGPVTIPAEVDRPEIVVQVTPNRVDVDEFNRWAAPLADGIARVVAGDLAVLLGTPGVAVGRLAHFDATYRVAIAVDRFDSIPGEAAVVGAVWVVHGKRSGVTRSGRTLAREAVDGPGFDALAAAHSRALARLSADIGEAIGAVAGGVPVPPR